MFHPARTRLLPALALLAVFSPLPGLAANADVATWPEEQRRFYQEGPAWLLPEDGRERLQAAGDEERGRIIAEFLSHDPDPETAANELELAIERRRELVEREFLTYLDDRARLLFLRGEPVNRQLVECDMTFRPLEIWYYEEGEEAPGYVLYEPLTDEPYRLWVPIDSKTVLYERDMQYFLQQVAEIAGYRRGPRFDRRLCKDAKVVDEVTGVKGLYDFQEDRPSNRSVLAVLDPPSDLAGWARRTLAEPPPSRQELLVGTPAVRFPDRDAQRTLVRTMVELPENAGLEVYTENERSEVRVKVEGLIERDDEVFETFHMRYEVPVEGDEVGPLALAIDRMLRPQESFVMRLRITDEIGGASAMRSFAFRVASEADPGEEEDAGIQIVFGEDVVIERIAGADSMVLIPPESDLVLGLWKAETLITGETIKKVIFKLDGEVQFTRIRAPFSAELRLAQFPQEHVVRVEGYDANGELVASDEVILNQQRGQLEVRLIEPKAGSGVSGTTEVRVNVVVPEERRVERVEFSLNEEVAATLENPPWEASLDIPPQRGPQDLRYVTAAAYLDDGTRAEDVAFLDAPDYLEEVEVDFVELYTTIDGLGNRELTVADFQVFENKRPQEIVKFEKVENVPLTIGISIDTSGSMLESLGEARRAATEFLESIIEPKDQSFAVAFADRPFLLMPRTSDVGAVKASLDNLNAVGSTALHDAVVTSLYYFRGVKGRKVLILLSDGADTASSIDYKEALEYARRSEVAIFPIGLRIPSRQFKIRGNLTELAQETGGRSFFISSADELRSVYASIEKELRSQFLIAYASDSAGPSDEFRQVELKVTGGLEARTMRGYYP